MIIVFNRYPSAYCLIQGSCFICSDFKFEHGTSKLESQPLKIASVAGLMFTALYMCFYITDQPSSTCDSVTLVGSSRKICTD